VQKQSVIFSITILMSLVVSCISMPSTQPVEVNAEPTSVLSASPTEPASLSAASTNPYLGCLSPALTMNAERAAHTATRLPDGKVLIAGGFREEGTSEIAIASAELFDSATNTFIPTSDMNEPRNGHTATLLPNGLVLLVGGWNLTGRTATAELYDPQTGTFGYTGSLMAPRQGLTATLLQDGRVLVAGGDSARNTSQLAAELYDPDTKTFTATGSLNDGRMAHTATILPNGNVLLVGGTSGNDNLLATAELYDPEAGQFTPASSANMVRYKHTAVLLQDGNVLILGGSNHQDWNGKYNSAEIYDVKTKKFTEISTMNRERFKLADAAVLLPNGNVLIGGGNRQIEIFDAESQEFVLGDILDEDYYYSVLTPLNDGSVLITGGYDGNILPSDKAWLYCG
jgi:WD40 repeat protein